MFVKFSEFAPHALFCKFALHALFCKFAPHALFCKFAPHALFCKFAPARPERAEAPSPGQRPGYKQQSARRPVRAKALLPIF